MMIPAGKSYYNNEKAKHFVEVGSQAIYHFFKGPELNTLINGRFCPQTRMATDTCNEVCGLAILDSILSWTIPKLGANVDVSSNIEQLSIKPSESLASFMLRCSTCDKAIRDAGVIISPNQMIKKMFKILNNCPQVVPYIATTTKEFQQHQRKN
jgi:hypothetical protein